MSAVPTVNNSLVALAERRQLPRHQFMDADTVAWIEANRPDIPDRGSAAPRLPPGIRGLIVAAALPASWYAEPRVADSIHGLRHGIRTAVLAAALAEIAGLSVGAGQTLVLASAVHDCRRLHDQDDPGHGARAGEWLSIHSAEVLDHFRVSGHSERIRFAAVAAQLHEIPYAMFSLADATAYQRAAQLVDLIKAADALDRYRLPKLKWWPDAAHLRVDIDPLREFAFDLVVRSESAHVRGVASSVSVLSALADAGVV